MKTVILQGSPRKSGNTKQFSDSFIDELQQNGVAVQEIWLYDMNIKPCLACKVCQSKPDCMGCIQEDDMEYVFNQCLDADLLVYSTPIYAFFASAPVKVFMDRFIYAAGKYYGSRRFTPMTKGKRCAVLATAGYPIESVVPIFTESVKKTCKHIGMEYLGDVAARDFGAGQVFMTQDKEDAVRSFARNILKEMDAD